MNRKKTSVSRPLIIFVLSFFYQTKIIKELGVQQFSFLIWSKGTRDGGAARAAGLRPGDVIVKCNGHRLTELSFEKAVEVMRGSGVLDLVVNRPTYYTPNPGETIFQGSSGYDSGNSSLLEHNPLPVSLQGAPSQTGFPGRPGHISYPQSQGPCSRNPVRARTGFREVQWADIDGKG